jgi:(2R)-ethylmalonyl-CoA mutase
MRTLFDQIPLDQMNTSMTINATAPWLLALYIAVAEEQGADVSKLQGTVQNDLIKEYLSRAPISARQTLAQDDRGRGRILLQERAQVEPDERVFLPPARGRRDAGAGTGLCAGHRHRRAGRAEARASRRGFPALVGRISFFVNAGIRFVTEMCKMRAFVDLWDEICLERYGVDRPQVPPLPLWRAGQLSLGLTEQQPENNVYRILIEMLAVTLSKKARARAVQLPAWNEALGLPRPWDQQWSMRMQQILAYETDLLEFDDLFDGNPAVDAKVEELKAGARARAGQPRQHGRRDRKASTT